MDVPPAWLAALVGAAPAAAAAAIEHDAVIGEALAHAIRRAQTAWPELALDPVVFAAHLGAKLADEAPTLAAIDALCVGDLWLACACLHDTPGAHTALERRHAGDVRRGLAGAEANDGMMQEVLLHLLVRGQERPPRIAEYGGRGNLGRWISVVTRRLAIDRLRAADDKTDEVDDGIAAAYGDPELAMLRGGTSDVFKSALEQAAAALQPRERNMLRYHYVHKLAIDEIAGIYRVSRSTARRRLTEVRDRLTSQVRERMRVHLKLDDRQLDRELAELQSAVAVTLSRILRSPK